MTRVHSGFKIRFRNAIGSFAASFAMAGMLATVAGFCGRIAWLFEVFSHFRLQIGCGLLICGLVMLAARRIRMAVVSLLVGVGLLATIVPLYLSGDAAPLPDAGKFRLLSSNVLRNNRDHELLFDLIEHEDPDVIVLVEVGAEWADAIRSLDEAYPFQVVVPRRSFGAAILSRIPLQDVGDACDHPKMTAAPVVRFAVGNQEMTLVAAHPVPPEGRVNANRRNAQLRQYATYVSEQTGPVILAGDLNCTSWSPYFKDLIRNSGLRDSRRGFGLQPSWPVGVSWLQIAIDHCLISPEIRVVDRRIGPDIGSDHRPVICDLAVTGK